MTEETGDGLAGREWGKEWMKNKSRVEEARRDERRQSENGAERFCWSSSLLLSRLMLSCHFQELIGTSSENPGLCTGSHRVLHKHVYTQKYLRDCKQKSILNSLNKFAWLLPNNVRWDICNTNHCFKFHKLERPCCLLRFNEGSEVLTNVHPHLICPEHELHQHTLEIYLHPSPNGPRQQHL